MSTLTVEVAKRFAGPSGGFSLEVSFQTDRLTTVIFGPSGSGKTTLLRAVAGLLRPDRGLIALEREVFFDGRSGQMLPSYRRRVGMVFQQPLLFPHLSVLENVLYAVPHASRQEAQTLLERFHISHVTRSRPRQISGGEQQRVAIARALAARPRLLLLDEPLSSVDAATRASVLADLKSYQTESGIPYLYVTHNRVEALAFAEEAILLDRGRVVASGAAKEILSSPGFAEAARVLGPDNVLAGVLAAHREAEGLSEIDLGGVFLQAAHVPLPLGSSVAVTIPSGDIILSADPLGRTSARNNLPGRVSRVLDLDHSIEVIVETPVPFRAHISRQALKTLGLSPGARVYLLIKAMAVSVAPLGTR